MNSFQLRVYFGDTDAIGVVYHANYLDFSEKARTEISRMHGLDIIELAKKGLFFLVRSASLNYMAPAKLDDILDIEIVITKFGNTSVEMLHKIKNFKTNQLLCEVICNLVFVEKVNGEIKSCKISEDIKEKLKLLTV
jgi:acyl-CoA thioester hydrolase